MMNTNVIKESARGYQPLSVNDVLYNKEREVYFIDEVTDATCADLIQKLTYLDRESDAEVKLYINSPGGSVRSGLAVYDCIRMMRSPVTTICIGIAASMGSIFFLAGEKRLMLPHSTVMIHDPSYGGGSYAGKKPDELKAELDSLIGTREKLLRIISERTGKSLEEVQEKTKSDSYFDAKDAIEFGLATEIATRL